jgi:hypothetical protein
MASRIVAEDGPEYRSRTAGGPPIDEQTRQRMQHLPVELRRSDVDLRAEAERLMNLGQFDQAIILLLAHQLLTLDRSGYLRLSRGKTNGRYVRETGGTDPAMASRLRHTIVAFERSYFGSHAILAPEFGALWRNNQEMESELAAEDEVAA